MNKTERDGNKTTVAVPMCDQCLYRANYTINGMLTKYAEQAQQLEAIIRAELHTHDYPLMKVRAAQRAIVRYIRQRQNEILDAYDGNCDHRRPLEVPA